MYLEGTEWSIEHECLERQLPKKLICNMPLVQVIPAETSKIKLRNNLKTPVYMTQNRNNIKGEGIVFEADLKTFIHPNLWILQGVALELDNNDDKQSEEIDHRNLENLDPVQLQSQFNTNKPVQHLFNPETCNIDENEDLANEIADSIYEIAFKLHPKEASKITGMIKEKGIHKMNMLLSKKEDLIEIIEKGYDMIIKNENN